MANLISHSKAREPFSVLDPLQYERFGSRLGALAREISKPDFLARIERSLDSLEGPLSDLAEQVSLISVLELLDGIEHARLAFSAEAADGSQEDERSNRASSTAPGGELLCYWPGRSLSTGEAEVASRGFFDSLDRPPIGLWLEAISRPIHSPSEKFEIAILAWIPPEHAERAERGRRACTNGSLSTLNETSKALSQQLRPILMANPRTRL